MKMMLVESLPLVSEVLGGLGGRDLSRRGPGTDPAPSAPPAVNNLSRPTGGGARGENSRRASAGPECSGNQRSPVKVSVCTESHWAACFLRSAGQRLYHCPKKKMFWRTWAEPGSEKRASHHEWCFRKSSICICSLTRLHWASTGSVCLFHSGFSPLPSFQNVSFFQTKSKLQNQFGENYFQAADK